MSEQATPLPRWVWHASFGLVWALGVWARCAGWGDVYVGGEVELVPADSHYYVRFAQLQAFPRFVTFDPFVNFPDGAHVYWPPLHTWFVALAIALVPSPEEAAAWVGPTLSALWLVATSVLVARLFDRRTALVATAFLALTPAAIESGALGNADHHVHEPFLALVVPLVFGRAFASGRVASGVVAGLVLAFGQQLTTNAFVLIGCVAAGGVLAARRVPAVEGVLRGACVSAVLAMALGALLFGPPLTLSYESMSLFRPLLALAVLGGAAGLAGGGWGWLVAGLAATAALSQEWIRLALHVTRADPLLEAVVESEPLWSDPAWAGSLLGVLLPVLPFGLALALSRAREDAARVWPVAITATLFLGAAALQARFSQGLVGAGTALVVLALPAFDALTSQRRWLRPAAASLGLLFLLRPVFGHEPDPPLDAVTRVRPTLRWLREHTPPAAEDPFGATRADYAVLADPLLGHFVTLWAERPAVGSTFSQAAVHVAGNARAERVLSATDDGTAYALARETGARYLLVSPARLFPASGRDELRTWLWKDAGLAGPFSTGHFALLYDSSETSRREPGRSYARVFEIVPGALLEGSGGPGEAVEASARLGAHTYARRAVVDERGRFEVRVAYASEYRVRVGGRELLVPVRREDVLEGATIVVGR